MSAATVRLGPGRRILRVIGIAFWVLVGACLLVASQLYGLHLWLFLPPIAGIVIMLLCLYVLLGSASVRDSASEVIAAPLDAVWSAVTDHDRTSRWNDQYESVTLLTAGPVRVGSRDRGVLRGGLQVETEVVALEPPRLIGTRTIGRGLTSESEVCLEPTPEGGTRVSVAGAMRVRLFHVRFRGLGRARGSTRDAPLQARLERIRLELEAEEQANRG